MNFKREIEIELRFRKAVDLGFWLLRESINTDKSLVTMSQFFTIFKFFFVHPHSINT